MTKFNRLALVTALFLGSGSAMAGAIVTGGDVKLGVNDLGSLNIEGGIADVAGTTLVGLRYLTDGMEYESTSHGCECEGWGVGIKDTMQSGYANDAMGTAGLGLVSFSNTATTATSVTSMADLKITHHFAPAAETSKLYRVVVTIENTGDNNYSDIRYRRTFDWDTSPTPFNEYVTIGGTAAATAVLAANDNGFCSSNPFANCSSLIGGVGDFTAIGPRDIGTNFDFGFGALASKESYAFEIFYGAADNKSQAISALAAVEAEVYSLGWSGLDANQDGFGDTDGRITPTFIFGFAGVGGDVIVDPEVPVPATVGLFGLALLGLGLRRRAK
ncbi:MAG: PEP-CTERM sorting domain-containing protein [Gammaproteobacteria bacterium]|nr:PEP-CTERM sorting domain-containing protein [Gammaproteobacteria bacterium]